MEQVERIDSVAQYNAYAGVDTLHPLVSVVNFNEVATIQHFRRYMGVYAVFLKNIKCGNITYGSQPYDYEDGTLVFISPGQIYGIDSQGAITTPSGYALVFHPDLLLGTNLGKKIRDYSFFSYHVSEALHLSKKERTIIIDCLKNIEAEIALNLDKHSKTLIVSNVELFLNYCMRFYDRQFITRGVVNKDILSRFEDLLDNYLSTGDAQAQGLPGVAYFAEKLHLSPNYFGDLLKRETGQTPLEHIHNKLIEHAKTRLYGSALSIQEIASSLGFTYQQHFTRLFKQKTGVTPNEFRRQGA